MLYFLTMHQIVYIAYDSMIIVQSYTNSVWVDFIYFYVDMCNVYAIIKYII